MFRDFAFEGLKWNDTVSLAASIPFAPAADLLVVEATVRVYGLRGGVDDANAGYVACGFVDRTSPGSGSVANMNAPFVVRKLLAWR
jgi:hypothetical protein